MGNREVPEVKTNKWADPPADILTRILIKHLDLNTDLTRVRGVCSSWRSSLPLYQHSSYKSHIQVPSLADGNHHRPLFLLETAFYFFSPINSSEGSSNSSGWITRMGQIAPNKWRLLNPLSYADSYNPEANGNEYMLTDPPIVGEINLLDCRVFMLAKVLTLVDELDFNAKPISTKVVGEWDLTSSTRPLSAILVLLAPDHVPGSLSSRILMLRPNNAQIQENEWVEISVSGLEDKKQNNFVAFDIAYCKDIFFVFQAIGDCWRVGTVNPSIKTLVLNPFASGRIIQTLSSVSLVPSKSNDCIYLVVEPIYGNIQCLNLMNEVKGTSQNYEDDILFCSNYVSFSFQSSKLLNYTLLQDKNSMEILYMFSNHVRFNKFTPSNSFLHSNLMPEGDKGLDLFKYRRYKENISLWHTTKIDKNEKSVLDFDDGKNRVLLLDVKRSKRFIQECCFLLLLGSNGDVLASTI
ncbi:unnamed protein product [Amaranthus hypochondriacus]